MRLLHVHVYNIQGHDDMFHVINKENLSKPSRTSATTAQQHCAYLRRLVGQQITHQSNILH